LTIDSVFLVAEQEREGKLEMTAAKETRFLHPYTFICSNGE
jgi:hypothetical protein